MLALGLVLDAIFGEPDWLWRRMPHPAVLFGRAIDRLEELLNAGARRRAKGAVAILVLVVAVWLAAWLLSQGIFLGVFEVLGAAVLLAQRGLTDHVGAVADGLRVSLAEGRGAVARIVGRDPETLDQAGVARAAIESAAENFSDGVAAPVFWFLIGGLPGIAVYKAVNTADSMIGHRSERFAEFGWAAARLDDLLNWIPARLAGGPGCPAVLLFGDYPGLGGRHRQGATRGGSGAPERHRDRQLRLPRLRGQCPNVGSGVHRDRRRAPCPTEQCGVGPGTRRRCGVVHRIGGGWSASDHGDLQRGSDDPRRDLRG